MSWKDWLMDLESGGANVETRLTPSKALLRPTNFTHYLWASLTFLQPPRGLVAGSHAWYWKVAVRTYGEVLSFFATFTEDYRHLHVSLEVTRLHAHGQYRVCMKRQE